MGENESNIEDLWSNDADNEDAIAALKLELQDLQRSAVGTEEADLTAGKFELAQEVHIDLDLGAGDLGQGGFLESLDFEWWGYALAGLGFVVIMIAKCMMNQPSPSRIDERFSFIGDMV